MKRIFRVISYFLLSLLILVIIITVSLNLYYNNLDKGESAESTVPPPAEAVTDSLPVKTIDKSEDLPISLLPYPKNLVLTGGTFTMPDQLHFTAPEAMQSEIAVYLNRLLGVSSISSAVPVNLIFTGNNNLPKEGYKLTIHPSRVSIQYSELQGLYYALITIKQLNEEFCGVIPCMEIEDYPDMEMRGVMLDIGRNKIPKLETLFGIVDLLSELKINHFELYMEGFCFAYPSYAPLWEKTETPITGEEFKLLDQYCKERFIDLVPNQNSLGHMMAWLETEQLEDLAECPKGFQLVPFMKVKSTIDPYDPRSIELVTRMTEDLLPNFSSDYFNANLDEPFELGKCKNKKKAEEIGVGQIYLDYVKKIHALSTKYDKRMMMWGEIINKHPDIISDLPNDIIVLEWGYEGNHPFNERCKQFESSGLDYLVCPGTSSWMTLTGRTDNMKNNIANAIENGIKYGSTGMLLTDWGDMGHWQYLPVSYAGYSYGAALSWNFESKDQIDLEKYLNRFVFKDDEHIMGKFVLDLGQYNQFEEFLPPNSTQIFIGYQLGLQDKILVDAVFDVMINSLADLAPDPGMIEELKWQMDHKKPYRYSELIKYLDKLQVDLLNSKMEIEQATLIREEFSNAIRMIRLGADLKYFIQSEQKMAPAERLSFLKKMSDQCQEVITEYKKLWLARNKSGGLETSMINLVKLNAQIDKEIIIQEKGAIGRKVHRIMEKAIAAAIVLFVS